MKKLLYFSAGWCQPCRQLSPVIEGLQSEGISVQKIDVDSNQEIAQQFGIRNIPTVVLTIDGAEIARKVGANPKQAYIDMYNQN